MDPTVAWQLTPWEFSCFERGFWKARLNGVIGICRGLTEKVSTKQLLETLMGEKAPSSEGDDEVMAASEERAYQARIKKMAKAQHG